MKKRFININMKTVCFVCHGNICRSPAAEYIFKNIIKKLNKETEYCAFSRATSYEEIGNDIYPPMKRTLDKNGISYSQHSATRFTQSDYENSDYIFYMDENNIRNLLRICDDKDNKFLPVFKWTNGINHIEDPWYTDNYQKVIDELSKCIIDILENIKCL